ncbi:hypothetical protein, partial [Enterobacter roggenkampii]|uniref:hypothetical protein n=1 Tax=Enterobacter roggenkampii TaxID=1812935 RepID=UPI003D6ED020
AIIAPISLNSFSLSDDNELIPKAYTAKNANDSTNLTVFESTSKQRAMILVNEPGNIVISQMP